MKPIKIVTDASCHRIGFYKGKSTGAAQYYDSETGELIHQEEFVLGDKTPYSAECETVLLAMDCASGFTRTHLEIWSDCETLIRQLNGDYLLKAPDAKKYFDRIKQLELRFREGVKYFHHDRKTPLAKAVHNAATAVYEKHHTAKTTS